MSFQLVIATGRHQGKSIRLKRSPFIIGRQRDCHLRAMSPEVSRQHCVLEIDGEHVRVKDLGSTNGTLVNNKKITGTQELHDRDVLVVGPLTLRFQTQASAAVNTHAVTQTGAEADTHAGVEASAETHAGIVASANTHAGVEVSSDSHPGVSNEGMPPSGNEEDTAATWMMNFDEMPAPEPPAPKPVQADTKTGSMAQSILERYKKK